MIYMGKHTIVVVEVVHHEKYAATCPRGAQYTKNFGPSEHAADFAPAAGSTGHGPGAVTNLSSDERRAIPVVQEIGPPGGGLGLGRNRALGI